MKDIAEQISAISRVVGDRTGDGGEVIAVEMSRGYRAAVEDVWDAVTDPDRVRRWFYPLSGELREGGKFQLEGHAGGEILKCEPPRLLQVTFGGPASIVRLQLSERADGETVLELRHTVPLELAGSVAGALFVGPGWDGAFMAVDRYLRGEAPQDPIAAFGTPEMIEFNRRSIEAWLAVIHAHGTATPDQIAMATEMARAQFAPDAEAGESG